MPAADNNENNAFRVNVKKEASRARKEQFVGDILKYVGENAFDPNISQINVADHFKISIYSLSRLFAQDIGVGFTEFITGKRIEKAKNELETTDRPISEIASGTGIPNVNYFSRLFKEMTGETPAKYRASKRTAN